MYAKTKVKRKRRKKSKPNLPTDRQQLLSQILIKQLTFLKAYILGKNISLK